MKAVLVLVATLLALPARAAPAEKSWLRVGVERQKAHDLDGAIAAYRKALEVKQTAPLAMYNLGTAYALKHQPDQAVEWLKKAAAAGFRMIAVVEKDSDLDGLRKDPRWPEVMAAFEKAAHPCQADPVHHQFDFWIGEWDVLGAGGRHVGWSSVQSILGGCVVFENWTGALGGSGKSFNYWDRERKRWRQTWVDVSGGNTDYVGALDGNAMRFQAEAPEPKTHARRRLTFFKLPDGRVRQLGEASTDGGKTWVVRYDLTYVRKK